MAWWDKYPYTDYHSLDVRYWIRKFNEIKNEWANLYDELKNWKTSTTEELETWKITVESNMQNWEDNLLSDFEEFKNNVDEDLTDFETNLTESLNIWKTDFETLFNITFSDLEQIKIDAENARDRAEASADAVEDKLEQIEINKNNIEQISTNTKNKLNLINNYNDSYGISMYSKNGKLYLSGTATRNCIYIISKTIFLNAGVYRFSGMDLNYNILIQIYHYDGGEYGNQIYQGRNDYTFTMLNDGNIIVRIFIYSDTNTDGCIISPQIEAGEITTDFVPYLSAYDAEARNKIDDVLNKLMENAIIISDGDLNDYRLKGIYYIGYSVTIINSPIENAQRYLYILPYSTALLLQVLYAPIKNKIFIRQCVNNQWFDWVEFVDKKYIDNIYSNVLDIITNNINIDFIENYNDSSIENNGIKLRILSYNVANYNNDSNVYINDKKLLNFRKMLYETKPDFICLQENRNYIDALNTKETTKYIFNPILPFQFAISGTCIQSKINAEYYNKLILDNFRTIEICIFLINNKKILLISAHPIADYNNTGAESSETINYRKTEYLKLFRWINGEIPLDLAGGSGAIYAPVHDYCIIGADTNAITVEDRNNLKNYADDFNFTLGNGDYIGWINTHKDNLPLDNIIVSNNIIINSFESLNSKYNELYSDHVPILAEITLT